MTQDEIKRLVERYPYLLPRNVWTDELPADYDYTYINGIGEIPRGWCKLFLQLCEDIRQPLIDADYLDKFRFSQIKEKYNRLECYNFGAPEEVQDIIDKYSVMAGYVCTRCGRPATCETQDYVASFCDDCWKDFVRHERIKWLQFKPFYKTIRFDRKGSYERIISFEDEWNRYVDGCGSNKNK